MEVVVVDLLMVGELVAYTLMQVEVKVLDL